MILKKQLCGCSAEDLLAKSPMRFNPTNQTTTIEEFPKDLNKNDVNKNRWSTKNQRGSSSEVIWCIYAML